MKRFAVGDSTIEFKTVWWVLLHEHHRVAIRTRLEFWGMLYYNHNRNSKECCVFRVLVEIGVQCAPKHYSTGRVKEPGTAPTPGCRRGCPSGTPLQIGVLSGIFVAEGNYGSE